MTPTFTIKSKNDNTHEKVRPKLAIFVYKPRRMHSLRNLCLFIIVTSGNQFVRAQLAGLDAGVLNSRYTCRSCYKSTYNSSEYRIGYQVNFRFLALKDSLLPLPARNVVLYFSRQNAAIKTLISTSHYGTSSMDIQTEKTSIGLMTNPFNIQCLKKHLLLSAGGYGEMAILTKTSGLYNAYRVVYDTNVNAWGNNYSEEIPDDRWHLSAGLSFSASVSYTLNDALLLNFSSAYQLGLTPDISQPVDIKVSRYLITVGVMVPIKKH